MPSTVELLERVGLFAAASPGTLTHLAARCTSRSYGRGEMVFNAGDRGDAVYVVKSGLVRLSMSSLDGDEIALAYLRPAESFGELAVLDGGPRTATATAARASVLLAIQRDDLHEVMARDRAVLGAITAGLSRLVRRNNRQLADLAFVDLEGRVARQLLAQIAASEAPVVDLSQTEIAQLVGGSRQSVNQILQRLAREGVVDLRHRQTRVLRPEHLRWIADQIAPDPGVSAG